MVLAYKYVATIKQYGNSIFKLIRSSRSSTEANYYSDDWNDCKRYLLSNVIASPDEKNTLATVLDNTGKFVYKNIKGYIQEVAGYNLIIRMKHIDTREEVKIKLGPFPLIEYDLNDLLTIVNANIDSRHENKEYIMNVLTNEHMRAYLIQNRAFGKFPPGTGSYFELLIDYIY